MFLRLFLALAAMCVVFAVYQVYQQNPADEIRVNTRDIVARQEQQEFELSRLKEDLQVLLYKEPSSRETEDTKTFLAALSTGIGELRQSLRTHDDQIAAARRLVDQLRVDQLRVDERRVGPSEGADSRQLADLLDVLWREVYLDGSAKVDWAQASLGATIAKSQTSRGLGTALGLAERVTSSFAKLKSSDRYRNLTPPVAKDPSVVLGPVAGPYLAKAGNCFGFAGQGNITVQLPRKIAITEVAVDHIRPQISPTTASAPRRVAIYVQSKDALSDEEPTHFVDTFDFDYPTVHRVFHPVATWPTQRVKFAFFPQAGSAYTCVYRVRVHGD